MTERVLRGGAWDYNPRSLRSAERGWFVPGLRIDNSGFRVTARPDTNRAIRGGVWRIDARYVRSTYRYWVAPSSCGGGLGFRLVVRS